MSFLYRVQLTADDNGTFLAVCPAIPEVTTFGETEDAAYAQAKAAIEEAMAARISDGRTIPIPDFLETGPGESAIGMSLQADLKVTLYVAMGDAGITRAELGRRLGWHREQVDRLFRLEHASRLDQLEAAFEALGRRIEVEVKDAA